MTSQPFNLETRINTLNAVISNEQHQQAVDTAFRSASGDVSAAFENLQQNLSEESLKKVTLICF